MRMAQAAAHLRRPALLHLLDVAAGGKGLARAGDDQALDRGIAEQAQQFIRQAGAKRQADGVHIGGAVERSSAVAPLRSTMTADIGYFLGPLRSMLPRPVRMAKVDFILRVKKPS